VAGPPYAGEAFVRAIALRVFAIGAGIFVAVTLLEQVPLVGFFGGLAEIGIWIYLAHLLVTRGHARLAQEVNPGFPAMLWSAAIGASTGLIGAAISFGIGIVALNAAVRSSSDPIGNMLGGNFNLAAGQLYVELLGFGLIFWLFVGAFVCGLFGLIFGSRLRVSHVPQATQPGLYGQWPTSPDGRYYWDGRSWQLTEVISTDGRFRWNGQSWEPIVPPAPLPTAPPSSPDEWGSSDQA
jgi:hypothetical protein